MKMQLIWVLEWRKSVHYWWNYILFAPEWKGLTCMLDPLLYRWGVPPVVIRCVHWTMQSGVLQTWITIQSPVVVMKLKEMRLPWQLIFIKVEISEYISNFYPFWEYIPRQQNWLARRWANVGTTVLALGVCAGLSKRLCNQFGQSLQKYFLRRKIFLAEKNIFLAEKNVFLAEKNISCGEKYFLRKKIFLAEKIYFLRRKKIFLRKEIYFLRQNIFCTMLPISFRSTCHENYSSKISLKSPQPQWVNLVWPVDGMWHHGTWHKAVIWTQFQLDLMNKLALLLYVPALFDNSLSDGPQVDPRLGCEYS